MGWEVLWDLFDSFYCKRVQPVERLSSKLCVFLPAVDPGIKTLGFDCWLRVGSSPDLDGSHFFRDLLEVFDAFYRVYKSLHPLDQAESKEFDPETFVVLVPFLEPLVLAAQALVVLVGHLKE